MKLKVKDGKGKRVITEVKRPDPHAVLIIEEEKEVEVSVKDLYVVVTLKYVKVENIVVDGKKVKSVYPDSIVFGEEVAVPVQEKAKVATPVVNTIKKV